MNYKRIARVLFWILLGVMSVACQSSGLNQTQLKLTEYRMGSGFVFENAAQARTGTLTLSLPNETKMLGELGFSKGLTEQTLDVSALNLSGDVALQIAHSGETPALIDFVALDGQPPYQVDGARETGELAVKKVAGLDQDLLHVQGRTVTLHFRVDHTAKQLAVTARIYPPANQITETQFQYPVSNLYKEMTSESEFYAYPWNSQTRDLSQGDDWSSATLGKPFFQEFSVSGTGHPSNFIYGWVSNDAENLSVGIDWTGDNTLDELTDYAKVYVKTPTGLKEFKVMDRETRWGRADFTYTERVVYQHRTYRFKIPLSEIGVTRDFVGNAQLAFAAYGTNAPPVTISTTGPAAAGVAAGTANHVIYMLRIDCNSAGVGNWTGISITTGGTYQTSDLVANSFKLYRSSDATLDAGDGPPLATAAIVVPANTLSFSGFNSAINCPAAATPLFYAIVTADIATTAVAGRTIQLGPVTGFIYLGGANANTSSATTGGVQTVKGNTKTTLTGPSGNFVGAQSFTFTATVTDASQLNAPTKGRAPAQTGTVTFFDNGVAIPTCTNVPLVGGVATCTVTLGVGTHVIRADYSGDANFAPSTSTTTLTLTVAQTVTISVPVAPKEVPEGDTLLLLGGGIGGLGVWLRYQWSKRRTK